MKPKIVVVVGPTASGKSALGEAIALKFGGEIISADSRQVYHGLDLGTGKEQLRVKQHLIDIVNPAAEFNVSQWKRLAERAITKLVKQKKLPVIVGGSSLYAEALIDNFQFAPPVPRLRQQLERLSLPDLRRRLRRLDVEAAADIEPNNRRYLIRAIERATLTGRAKTQKGPSKYQVLLLAPKLSRGKLYNKIDRRVDSRLKEGMLQEVRALLASGVNPDWMRGLGLEYKFLTNYLMTESSVGKGGQISADSGRTNQTADHKNRAAGDCPADLVADWPIVVQQLKYAIHHFARRQLIWWQRRSDVHWVASRAEALTLVKRFLR